jgi:hypothetical protein
LSALADEIPPAADDRFAMAVSTVSSRVHYCEIPMTTPTAAGVQITEHCVRRYTERVKPDMDLEIARRELEQLKGVCAIATSAPSWTHAADPAAYYLMIGSDVVLPLIGVQVVGGRAPASCSPAAPTTLVNDAGR